MGQTGEDRHLDENSDDETDEEEDSEEEDEDVTGSEDEDDDDEDEDEDDEDEDEDDDDDDEDGDEEDDDKNGNADDAKFQDEPKTPINGSSNIVEDYGVETVPGDEDLEKGERPKTSEEDSQRSKRTLGLVCCLVILAAIGTALGVTLGKKDDETTTSREAATLPPVPVPATPVPVPVPATLPPKTAAPTANNLQYTIPASADSYIFISGGEEGPFGKEDSLLIQRMDSGESLALMNFDVPMLPPPEILGFSPKALLVLTLVEENGRAPMEGNATMEGNSTLTSSAPLTLVTGLISGFSGDIETITSNSSSVLEQLNQTRGPSFPITQGSREISVDISSLLASSADSESPDIVLRRLQMPGSSKILLGLMADDADGNFGSVRFYSSQSPSPPRISIDLTDTSSSGGGCPICGEGNNVTNPDMALDLPQIGNVTCAELEYIASTDVISDENCALLQPYIHSFCCEDEGDAKIFVCELCLDGGNITNPSSPLSIAGQVSKTCGEYQGMALQGSIPKELCTPLQLLSDEVCCGIEL